MPWPPSPRLDECSTPRSSNQHPRGDHMHARVVKGTLKPGKLDDFLRLYENEIAGDLKQAKGFEQVFLTVDRDDDSILALAVYSTRDDAEADEAGFKRRAAKAAPLLISPPESSLREVTFHI